MESANYPGMKDINIKTHGVKKNLLKNIDTKKHVDLI